MNLFFYFLLPFLLATPRLLAAPQEVKVVNALAEKTKEKAQLKEELWKIFFHHDGSQSSIIGEESSKMTPLPSFPTREESERHKIEEN